MDICNRYTMNVVLLFVNNGILLVTTTPVYAVYNFLTPVALLYSVKRLCTVSQRGLWSSLRHTQSDWNVFLHICFILCTLIIELISTWCGLILLYLPYKFYHSRHGNGIYHIRRCQLDLFTSTKWLSDLVRLKTFCMIIYNSNSAMMVPNILWH